MRRVEVLRRKQGAYSGIKVVCILRCIGRDAPFGAKPPQAGSTESLMFLSKGKELFYHKGCNFTYVGVDQIRRRSLRGASTPWFPLFIAGALQLRKLRLRRLFVVLFKEPPSSTPAPLRMTKSAYGCIPYVISYRRRLQCEAKSADGFRSMRSLYPPNTKTTPFGVVFLLFHTVSAYRTVAMASLP
jgi:hypothetical protein